MQIINTYPSSPIQSSKIYITGPLVPSMPYIVLKELALECNMIVNLEYMKEPYYYIKVFKKISKINPPIIDNLNDPLQFNQAVDIVNPLQEWEVDSLRVALCFLNFFQNAYKENKSYSFYSYIPFGLQTPTMPYRINACIFYAICRFKNIHVSLDITYEELKQKVLDSYLSPVLKVTSVEILDSDEQNIETNSEHLTIESYLSSQNDIPSPKENDIILSIDLTKCPIQDKKFNFFDNFNTIENIGELFEDLNYVRQQYSPLNDEQAIVAAAIVHHRDLSKSAHPLRDYDRFMKDKNDCIYPSGDSFLQYIHIHNPNYIDLNVYFNPYLPKTLYKKQTLNHHLQLFSYASYLYIGLQPYEILQELYLEENFHLGWHPNIMNQETPIDLDVINELLNEQIICYGIREESMHATTWDELYQLFKNMNLFVNPFEKSTMFHHHKIERLSRLGKWILNPSLDHRYLFCRYDSERLQTIRNFVELVDDMLLFQKTEFESFKEYNIQYSNMSIEEKDRIRTTLEKLFELTMFMRGWKRDHPYPIDIVPSSNIDETEKNSLDALISLDEWNQKSNDFIYSLPLMIWKNEFFKSQLSEQGFTIGDRIAIVKSGESESINSCIRMTSNVFGASYCFYCKLFKIPEKFDIKDLIYIQ